MNEQTILEAINCDARDGLMSVHVAAGFSRTKAYEVSYAPGSEEELTEAMEDIKAAFPSARVFKGERDLIVIP